MAVEALDVKGMVESPRNSRNTASAAWNTFTDILEYKFEREGAHFVAVAPDGTTKECARYGVTTDKPLWVREHSCLACGFEVDRDANAAWNIVAGTRTGSPKCVSLTVDARPEAHGFSRGRKADTAAMGNGFIGGPWIGW